MTGILPSVTRIVPMTDKTVVLSMEFGVTIAKIFDCPNLLAVPIYVVFPYQTTVTQKNKTGLYF